MMLPPDPVYIFKGEMDSVMCLVHKITDSVEQLYSGTQSGNVHVWNLRTMREIGNFSSGDDSCLSINISEKNNIIITQNKSGTIRFWHEENNKWSLVKDIKTNFFGFCKAFTYKDLLYTSLKDSHFQLICVESQKTVKKLKLSETNIGEIMMFKVLELQDKLYFLVACEGHQLILWSSDGSEKISCLQLTECPMAYDFDVKSCKGLYGSPSNQIHVFLLTKNLQLKIVRSITLMNDGVACIKIRPDNKLVAVGCWDGKLRLYSWKTFTLLAALDIHTSTIQDVNFIKYGKWKKSYDKYLLAAGSKDGRISLWDIYN